MLFCLQLIADWKVVLFMKNGYHKSCYHRNNRSSELPSLRAWNTQLFVVFLKVLVINDSGRTTSRIMLYSCNVHQPPHLARFWFGQGSKVFSLTHLLSKCSKCCIANQQKPPSWDDLEKDKYCLKQHERPLRMQITFTWIKCSCTLSVGAVSKRLE